MIRAIDSNATASFFGSGRDDATPFVGLRIECKGDITGEIAIRFDLEELNTLIKEAQETRQQVIEFEVARPRARNANG